MVALLSVVVSTHRVAATIERDSGPAWTARAPFHEDSVSPTSIAGRCAVSKRIVPRRSMTVKLFAVSYRPVPTLTVTFHKVDGRSPHAWWEAVRTTRGRVRGGYMPIGRGRIPHDLGHMATEAHLGIHHGFWGLLARGATFDHGTQQRRTQPGRRLIRENRAALEAAEAIGNEHHFAWARGEPTPVAPTFDRLAGLWEATPDGGTLTIRWPTLELADAPTGVAMSFG